MKQARIITTKIESDKLFQTLEKLADSIQADMSVFWEAEKWTAARHLYFSASGLMIAIANDLAATMTASSYDLDESRGSWDEVLSKTISLKNDYRLFCSQYDDQVNPSIVAQFAVVEAEIDRAKNLNKELTQEKRAAFAQHLRKKYEIWKKMHNLEDDE